MEEETKTFDVCVICALYEEAEAVINEFSQRCNVIFQKAFSELDHYVYYHSTIRNNGGESLTVLVTWLSESGPTQTGLDFKPFLHEFHPRFVAMAGFCAGYKKKVKRGDLVVAQYAYFYEAGKVVRDAEGLSHHLQEMKVAFSSSQVLHYARGFDNWKEPVKKMKTERLKRELKNTEEPHCVIAPMASGMVVRQDDPFSRLRENYDRNTAGLDMEAAAFYQALRAVSHIHGLVVKGVCDYADMNKNDTYHDYAARASAIYLLSFIQEYVTEQTMPRRYISPSSSRAGPTGVWNIPYARNLHFTGRDDLLEQLRQQLMPTGQNGFAPTRSVALRQPLAIKGLGGIGKTQIAVEYAYRSRDQGYYVHMLWVNAASEETIMASFAAIAEVIPEITAKHETDLLRLAEMVKRWLEQSSHPWLIIFDNLDYDDNIAVVQQYFPQQGNGSILLTTRANAVGSFAISIEVDKMGLTEGVQLLLRRASRFEQTPDEEVNEAFNIVIALDHFPLALDQAGAYIEETGCSLTEYLQLYRSYRKNLLARRGTQATIYPESVATTWLLSFRKVAQANPAAAELLHLCSFLAPDRIPEELIREGITYWPLVLHQATSDPLLFNQMLEALFAFSLIKRLSEDRMFSIHRLVQAVQIDSMEANVQYQWVESIVHAVNRVFPKKVKDITTWPQCLRLLDQAQTCSLLITNYHLSFIDAADLLNRTGVYVFKQGLYSVAEPLLQAGLSMREQQLGYENSETATSLSNLALLYQNQGKYEEADSLYERAINISVQQLGSDHPETIASLINLALLYQCQGKYEEAEQLYLYTLEVNVKRWGKDHLDTAASLHNLATLYHDQGKYDEAEPLYERVLHIREQQLGVEHPDTITNLTNLATLYQDEGKYAKAEPLLQRALQIHERLLGSGHPDTAACMTNLALFYRSQHRYMETEPLLLQALHIWEQQLGVEHPDTAISLTNLAVLYQNQGRYDEAEPLYQRALRIHEQQSGPEHPNTATCLINLATLCREQGKYAEAEPLFRRALNIYEQKLGVEHPKTATCLTNLATLYQDQEKYDEAELLLQRALNIREQKLGAEHPETAMSLNNLATVYLSQEKYAEAESLLQRAFSVHKQHLGSNHPDTAVSMTNLASIYMLQGKYAEAEPLYRQALLIYEQQFGHNHPQTLVIAENYFFLLKTMERDT